MQCAGGAGRGDLYSRLVSVFPARELLFAVFERPQGAPAARTAPAALCAFRFADVQAAIRAARTACFVEPAPDVVAVLDSVVQGTGPACERKRNIQVCPGSGGAGDQPRGLERERAGNWAGCALSGSHV